MATETQIYQLLLKTEGEEKAKTLAAAVALAEQKFKALYDQLGKGDAATKAAGSQLLDLQKQLEKAGGTGKAAGQTLNQLGYVVDDLQYGFKGVANNIQPILSTIPALAGLAGPISIAAIAAFQLYEHWDQLAGLFGKTHTKTQAEEIEELGKKTSKTADETARLLQLEERRAAAKAQEGGKTEAEQHQAGGVRAAVIAAPYEQAREAVGRLEGDAFRKAAPEELTQEKAAADEALDFARRFRESQNKHIAGTGDANVAAAVDRVKAAQDQLDAAFNQRVTDYLADLEKDADKLKAFVEKAKKNKGALGPNADKTLKALEDALKTPEELQNEQDQADADREAMAVRSKAAEEEERRRVEDRDEDLRQEEVARQREEEIENKRVQWEEENRRKDEARLAADFAKGQLGRLAATGKLTDEDVKKQLRNSGHFEADVNRLAPGVAGHLRDQGDEQARDRAAKDGVGFFEAQRRIQADQDRADRDRVKDLVDAGGEQIAAQLKAGGNLQGAQAQLFNQLKAKFGAGQARLLVGMATQKGLRQQADDQVKTRRPSQVIDTAGLADSIQSGVGGDRDAPRQAVEELKKANEKLDRIINQPANGAPILRR